MGSLLCGFFGPSLPRIFLETHESPEYDELYFHIVPLSLERSMKGYGIASRKVAREFADVIGKKSCGDKVAVTGGYVDRRDGFVEYSRMFGTWAFDFEEDFYLMAIVRIATCSKGHVMRWCVQKDDAPEEREYLKTKKCTGCKRFEHPYDWEPPLETDDEASCAEGKARRM